MGVFGAVSRDTWLRVSAPQSQGGQCQPVGYFPSEQSHDTQAPSESCMHACSLQLTLCVCACVFKEIAAVKDSLCQFGGPLLGYMVQIWIAWHSGELNKYWFVCFPLSFCGQSVIPFSLTGGGFIAAGRLNNPLKKLSSSSHWCYDDFLNFNASITITWILARCSTGTSQSERRGCMSLSRLQIWAGWCHHCHHF